MDPKFPQALLFWEAMEIDRQQEYLLYALSFESLKVRSTYPCGTIRLLNRYVPVHRMLTCEHLYNSHQGPKRATQLSRFTSNGAYKNPSSLYGGRQADEESCSRDFAGST